LEKSNQNKPLLIAWDAPLSFEPDNLYDRNIDKHTRQWIEQHSKPGNQAFEKSAINALPFAGCPHWVISCMTLGLPFKPHNMKYHVELLHDKTKVKKQCVYAIEVHPAVALGAWWLERKIKNPLQRYKGNKKICKGIAQQLGFPCLDNVAFDDDMLDAYVAYKLGKMYLCGSAKWQGDAFKGGYIMPIFEKMSFEETLCHGGKFPVIQKSVPSCCGYLDNVHKQLKN
jgi:hypothetical protein